MMVVVEGRQPNCWNCKQVDFLVRACPQKATDTIQQPKEPEDHTTNMVLEAEKLAGTDNEWTQVTRRRREKRDIFQKFKDPLKALVKLNMLAPKETVPASSLVTKNKNLPFSSPMTPKKPSHETPPAAALLPAPRKITSFRPKNIQTSKETLIDTTQNLKRRRDSGEGQAKKLCL